MTVPLLNASGCLDALTAPEVARSLDAFVSKTITPLPRQGNPPIRIAETEAGMLNSIGLQGPGIHTFLAETLPRLRGLGVPLWVSVGGFSADDFAGICARLDEREEVDTIELNLSCPNVEEAPETSAEIVSTCRSVTGKPLYAKLVNTIRGLALDPRTLRLRLGSAVGGYSGPALKPIALHCVYACAGAVDLPIVAMGGVRTGLDALELVAAGASAVALGTVLFTDPGAPGRIRVELDSEATTRGFADALAARDVSRQTTQKPLHIA